MKKNKTQKAKNLSKAQLKKLKGGLIYCHYTACIGGTCGNQVGNSGVYCSETDARTVSITDNGGSGTTPKTKK